MPNLDPAEHTMSFGDHLDELRRRMLLALAAPLPLFIVMFFMSDVLMEWLLRPVYVVLQHHGLPPALQVLSPPEFLLAQLKVSLIAAVVLSAPWLLWQAWLFVAPGLHGHERRFVYFLLPGSAVLTAAGVLLLYYVMLPLMLHVLVLFAAEFRPTADAPPLDPAVVAYLDHDRPASVRTRAPDAPVEGEIWLLAPALELYVGIPDEDGVVEAVRVERPTPGIVAQAYRVSFVVDFTLVLMLGISIAFQMPLVIVLLGWLGLVEVSWLRKKRRHALAVCGVLSAMVTPADAVSMVLMLVPLYGLYELGILLLQLAPASSVAEGRVLRDVVARAARARDADKGVARSAQADDPVRPVAGVPRERNAPEADRGPADGEGEG